MRTCVALPERKPPDMSVPVVADELAARITIPRAPVSLLTYAVEPLTPGLIAEMSALQETYWKEVAGPFHNFPPDVAWSNYLSLESQGMLRVLCGRDSERALKGGAVVTITPHPHYACILASLPLLFIDPAYRRGREGLRLVKMAEDVAAEAGAQLMMTHGGAHNGVYRLFEHLNYNDFGRYFVKVLANSMSGTEPVFKKRETS
jgi:GNAT superfamily N-acetyltransferase